MDDELKRPLYRHLYDAKGRPIVTICTIEGRTLDTPGEHPCFCRGIAICSPLDITNGNFSKKRGRTIARGRALKAFQLRNSWGKVEDRGFLNAYETDLSEMFPSTIALMKNAYTVTLDAAEAAYFGITPSGPSI